MLPGMNNNTSKTPSTSTDASDVKIYDELDRFELWFAMAWKWLVRASLAIIACAIIIASICGYSYYAEKSKAEALYLAMENDSIPKAERMEKLKKLIEIYDDVEAAVYPRFLLAKSMVDSGLNDDAIVIYQYIEQCSAANEYSKARAKLNRANVLELQGKIPEAVEVYSSFLAVENEDEDIMFSGIIQIEAAYAAARLQYTSNQMQAAQGTLDKMRENIQNIQSSIYPYTPYAQLIQRLQEQITANNSAPLIGADLSKLPGFDPALLEDIPTTPAK